MVDSVPNTATMLTNESVATNSSQDAAVTSRSTVASRFVAKMYPNPQPEKPAVVLTVAAMIETLFIDGHIHLPRTQR